MALRVTLDTQIDVYFKITKPELSITSLSPDEVWKTNFLQTQYCLYQRPHPTNHHIKLKKIINSYLPNLYF